MLAVAAVVNQDPRGDAHAPPVAPVSDLIEPLAAGGSMSSPMRVAALSLTLYATLGAAAAALWCGSRAAGATWRFSDAAHAVARGALPWLPATALVQIIPESVEATLRPCVFIATVGCGAAACWTSASRAVRRAGDARREREAERRVFVAALSQLAPGADDLDETRGWVGDGDPDGDGEDAAKTSASAASSRAWAVVEALRRSASRVPPLSAAVGAVAVSHALVGITVWGRITAPSVAADVAAAATRGAGWGSGGSGADGLLERRFREYADGDGGGGDTWRAWDESAERAALDGGDGSDSLRTMTGMAAELAEREYLQSRVRELSREVSELRGSGRGGRGRVEGGYQMTRAEKDAEEAAVMSQRARANLAAAAAEEKRRQARMSRELEHEKIRLDREVSQSLRQKGQGSHPTIADTGGSLRGRRPDHQIAVDVKSGKVTQEHARAADLLRRLGRVAKLDTSAVRDIRLPAPPAARRETATWRRRLPRGGGSAAAATRGRVNGSSGGAGAVSGGVGGGGRRQRVTDGDSVNIAG